MRQVFSHTVGGRTVDVWAVDGGVLPTYGVECTERYGEDVDVWAGDGIVSRDGNGVTVSFDGRTAYYPGCPRFRSGVTPWTALAWVAWQRFGLPDLTSL